MTRTARSGKIVPIRKNTKRATGSQGQRGIEPEDLGGERNL